LLCSIVLADNWSTYMHDNPRSGVSTESVNANQLNKIWKINSSAPPMIAWDGGTPWDAWRSPSEASAVRNTPMRDFDFVNFVTVADGNLYYGSSVDDSVHCVNSGSGSEKWIFTTDGPVRFPPTIYNNKLYFGSDDGYAYCIDASTGTQIWRYTPSIPNRLIVNNGKFIPMQPIRTGVAIYDGKAYFASSLVPWKSSYLCAVNANTGTQIYKVSGGTTPMGALLVSSSKIYIPQGRLPPNVFNRSNGSSAGTAGPYGQGGCYALLISESTPKFSYGWGRQHENGYDLYEYNADTLTTVSEHLNGRHLIVKNGTAYLLTDTTLSAINRSNNSTIWSVNTDCIHSLILVDNVLLAGGFNKVVAYSTSNGSKLKTITIKGTARGLAYSAQRLFVSTDNGSIYSFGEDKNPIINNLPASNITDVSADFNGELLSTGQAPTSVILYWDTVDHGVNGGWANFVNFGLRSLGNISTSISGLNPKTTYYYIYCASNSFGKVFASGSESFKTYSTPEINNANGASNIKATSAKLNANLTEGILANVTFYWGTTDGGTTPANWQSSQLVVNATEGNFSLNISSLTKTTTYYYTTYAINSYGSDWAPSSSYFKTKLDEPNPSTIVYWRFEEGTAGQAHSGHDDGWYLDSSMYGYDLSAWGSEVNPTASSDVKSAKVPRTGEDNDVSLSFNGSSTVISGDSGSGLNTHNFSSGITIELIAKFNAGGTVAAIAKTGRPSTDGDPTCTIKRRADNRLQFTIFDGAGTKHDLRSDADVVPVGSWCYIAGVCNGTDASLYILRSGDAGYQLVASATGFSGGALYSDNEKWSVGAGRWSDEYPNGYVDGLIDEVRISDTALPTEMFLGTIIPEPGLIINGFALILTGWFIRRKFDRK